MAAVQQRDPQGNKIETARDLQAKLYREIGISAVAAALRFTTRPDSVVPSTPAASIPLPTKSSSLAA